MTKISHTECDSCGVSLNNAGAMPTYGLKLSSFAVPNSGGIINSILVYPIVASDMHFCGLNCLAEWAHKRSDNMPKQEVSGH